MSPDNTWMFLLLVCISSIVHSKTCTWLQDDNKELPKKMLNNFQNMIPENETSDNCGTNRSVTCRLNNTWETESVAAMVREVFYRTIQLYIKHQEKLVRNQAAWEQFQKNLHHQVDLLKDCISPTVENWIHVQPIRDSFRDLEKILEEQEEAVCARIIIHANIKDYLLQTTRLSSLMRKRQYVKTP